MVYSSTFMILLLDLFILLYNYYIFIINERARMCTLCITTYTTFSCSPQHRTDTLTIKLSMYIQYTALMHIHALPFFLIVTQYNPSHSFHTHCIIHMYYRYGNRMHNAYNEFEINSEQGQTTNLKWIQRWNKGN